MNSTELAAIEHVIRRQPWSVDAVYVSTASLGALLEDRRLLLEQVTQLQAIGTRLIEDNRRLEASLAARDATP